MSLRVCIPLVGRGLGLGNALIPWARAFIAATVLDIPIRPPAFGLSTRRYWRHFGTPRYDWIGERALLAALPRVDFDERAFREYGGDRLSDAVLHHAERHGLRERNCYAWTTAGMWGGYRHLAEARDFIRATLYRSRFAAGNLLRLRSRLAPGKLTVGMHMRLGDFAPPTGDDAYRGRFNMSLPSEWYVKIAQRIRDQLGDQVQFLVVSDGTPEQIANVAEPIAAVTTLDISDSDCSDLLALADCDLLVCSVSSYSAWAAFLSGAPYLWFEPQLQRHPEGVYSIWGHEEEQRKLTGATSRAIAAFQADPLSWRGRGIPVGLDGMVPVWVIDDVAARKSGSDCDLINYGVASVIDPDAKFCRM